MIHPPRPLPIGAEWLNAMPHGHEWTPPAHPAQPVQEVRFHNVIGNTSGQPTQVVVWLYAVVVAANLGKGTKTNDRVRNWVQHEVGNDDDDACHIIGKKQRGLGTVKWNIFPQNKNFNRGVFSRDVEMKINNATRYGPARIWFRFIYDNPSQPGRPTKFWYFIHSPKFYENNDLLNP